MQISFQFGWCDVNVICDGNKGSIKYKREKNVMRQDTYISIHIVIYSIKYTHDASIHKERSTSYGVGEKCSVHVT